MSRRRFVLLIFAIIVVISLIYLLWETINYIVMVQKWAQPGLTTLICES